MFTSDPLFKMAERAGFEPAVHLLGAYNRLAGDRFRPLSHLSAFYLVDIKTMRQIKAHWTLLTFYWRREQDSNPRDFRPTVFKTAAFDLSAIPP